MYCLLKWIHCSPKIFYPGATKCFFLLLMITLFIHLTFVNGIHVIGVWNPSPSAPIVKVITRFGFQKTDQNHRLETSGYIYGNVTMLDQRSIKNFNDSKAILLFTNRTLYKHIDGIQLRRNYQYLNINDNGIDEPQNYQNNFCMEIFNAINDFDKYCNSKFVRYIPCSSTDKLYCRNNLAFGLPYHQVTFPVDSDKDASFWYVLLLHCAPKKINQTTCSWTGSVDTNVSISYNLWIVNGVPYDNINIFNFDHQFSYEQLNVWFYIILTISYTILFAIQIYALSRQKLKNLNYLFTISLFIHTLAFNIICLHKIVFARNGMGFETLFTIAEIMKIMSTGLLMLFALIIAKGWPFTKPEVISKTMLIILSIIYMIIKILLFVWIKYSMDTIEEVDEYHTIPSWIGLCFRIILVLWFTYELRHTMTLEQDARKLKFYLHFGAGMLVWFVQLPVVALVGIHIDIMWRCKIITGFSSVADFLAFAILARILWKTNRKQFLIADPDEEMYYYDDITPDHSETYKFSNANSRSKHLYDNHATTCDTIKT